MLARVHRRFALVLLLPLGVTAETARAGLVVDSTHGLSFADATSFSQSNSPADEFDLLALRAPGEDPLALSDARDNDSYAGPAIFGAQVIPDVLAIAPRTRFDLEEPSSPFARYGPGSSISDLLTEASFATDLEFAAGRHQTTANPIGTDSTMTRGAFQDPFAGAGTISFTVPEPTVLLLLAAGIPAIIGRRPRHRP